MSVNTEVKVSELMQRDVFVLSADMPVPQAIGVLEENRVTGAPVTDSTGRLVGFLSLRDIASSEHMRDERLDAERREHMFSQRLEELAEQEPEEELWTKEDYSPEILAGDTVQDWMNPEVISVAPEADLRRACQVMAAEKIHAVLVVDGERLVGILSTSDIVRYIAQE